MLFVDLSKVFFTINHELLLAKFRGFSNNAMNVMCSYLKSNKQRVPINKNFSYEKKVIAGISLGSIDGSLSFNLFINNRIVFVTTLWINYADDNSLYNTAKGLEPEKSILVKAFRAVKEWFYEKFMILNPSLCVTICHSLKCHYMCGWKITVSDLSKFKNVCLENCREEGILGVTIDNKLTFYSHIESICRKAGQKPSAPFSISS